MRLRMSLSLFACCCIAVSLGVGVAHATTTITGADAVSALFDPNQTSPKLDLDGPGATPNSGGVAVFSSSSFTMDVDFLNNSRPDTFDDIILTVALDSALDYSGVMVSVSYGGMTAILDYDAGDFTDAETFGLPFPRGGIRGIANGAGDFLSLNGALVAGIDLQRSLTRGVNDPLSVQVDITGLATGPIRFDAFGLDDDQIVIGNNPNSGAAGFLLPEPSAPLLFAVGSLVAGYANRRYRSG